MVNNIYELLDNVNMIDKDVAFDILKRIIDWISQGNSVDGAYIQQNLFVLLLFLTFLFFYIL